MRALLFIVLFSIMSVCFADAGEVNPREYICASVGNLAKATITAKKAGRSLTQLYADTDEIYAAIEYDKLVGLLKEDVKSMIKEVYESTEDTTQSAAYATQYTKCLVGETFKKEFE